MIDRLDSEDERNRSGVSEADDDGPTDTVDNPQPINGDHEFKKPLLPTEKKPVKRKHKKHNSNGNTVISRDDAMILVPDGLQSTDGFTFIRTPRGSDNENSDTEVRALRTESTHSREREFQFQFSLHFQQTDHPVDFHLANCLDYIKAGVESIIEDEVTSRFEAEELKNWNLLTRTNRYHEFISWRLSIIWFIGFFIRYFILMPFRVIICFVGVSV